jgi:hypothetical protein
MTPLAAGCGEDNGRLSVSGVVTLDGAALDKGSILLTSMGGGPLVSSGAMIENGAYVVPEEHGLLPGTYLVQISSADSKAATTMAGGAPGMQGIPIAPDRIPAEYNINSDKKVEVTRDGDNRFDFDVVSNPAS